MAQSKGNILFLILIAVALFAALSYAVTSSSRSGESGVLTEKKRLAAGEILQYLAQLEQAITRMNVIDGISVEYIDVSVDNGYNNLAANDNCSADRCKLFSTEGGGVFPRLLPKAATDLSAGNYPKINEQSVMTFTIVTVDDVGTSASDLTAAFGGVDPAVCEAINVQMGVMNKGDTIPIDHQGAVNYQEGNLIPYPTVTGRLGDGDARIKGHRTFCVFSSFPHWGYYIYHVIAAR